MQANHNSDELAAERTLLAAERTFSAWIRTGLAGVGGGLAIARALTFQSHAHQVVAHVVSGLLLILGAAVFVYAIVGYRSTCKRLAQGGVLENSLQPLLAMTALLSIVAVLAFWLALE